MWCGRKWRTREKKEKDFVEDGEWLSSVVRISVYIEHRWPSRTNKNPKVLSTDHSPINLSFYLDFADRKEQSATSTLGSVPKQVVGGLERIPEELSQLFRDGRNAMVDEDRDFRIS